MNLLYSRKTWITASIVASIVSIFYILVQHYGLVRFVSLYSRYGCTPDILERYSALQRASTRRVVIVFNSETAYGTTDDLKPMLYSVLDQTARVDQIMMVIQPSSSLEIDHELPPFLKDTVTPLPTHNKHTHPCESCIVPILFKEKERDTLIIVLDNTVVYGKDFIERIVETHDTVSRSCIVTDPWRYAMAFTPSCYSTLPIERDQSKVSTVYNKQWFIQNAKEGEHVFPYTDNYIC